MNGTSYMGKNMRKGFVFSVDAMLSVLVLAALVTSIMYFSSSKSYSNLPLLDLERKGNDMMVVLDKSGILGSGNTTAISQAVNQTLASSVGWNLTVEYYNYSFNIGSQWANSSFDRCKDIVITNAGTTSLTDFPAYVNVTYDADMLVNYSDLRFHGASCGNDGALLDYQVENYTAANANTWIRIPTLAAGDTTIAMYYKNNTAVSSGQNAAGVWDSNFLAAWHLNENPTSAAPQFIDSANGNNGTARNMTAGDSVTGIVDGGLNFNGANATVLTNSGASVRGSTQYTISAWVKTNVVDGAKRAVYEEEQGTAATTRMKLCISTTNLFTLEGRAADGTALQTWATSTTPTVGTWYYVAGVFDSVADIHHLFVNGVYVNNTLAAAAISNTAPTDTPVIGARAVLSEFWDGTIDELEISNTARSADWLNQRYSMEGNQNSYVGFGTELSRGVLVAFELDQNSTLGSYDSDTGTVAYRTFVVKNASTGLIDRYGRAILKMWVQ